MINMSKEKLLLEDAKELIAYSADTLKNSLKSLSKKYKDVEKTFFEEAYVPTEKRDQLLKMLKQDIESGTFGLLYFIAPFGFGKTFFVEHMKGVIGKLEFGKKYKVHIIPVSMYAVTLNDLIISIARDISENVLTKDAVEVANEYFFSNQSRLVGFSIELIEKASKRKITKEDLEVILRRLGINDIMDFITELLRRSFNEKETVCIFIIDELEKIAQEEKGRISSYGLFFSKLIRQSIEIPHWKLILSAPLEITEHESRHPLLEMLSQDAADRLRDFDKDEYKLLFEAKEAIQFMIGMLNKTFVIISSKSQSKDGKKWLGLLEKYDTFPIDADLLEILAKTGLRQIGEQGLIQDFRSYIALVRYTIEVWLKHYDKFLESDSPPINFNFFSEYSEEIQQRMKTSVDAAELGGINRAIFKYNIEEFLEKHIENKSIAEFLLSITQMMKTEKQRKNAFDLSEESKKHHFKADALITELKKIPSDMGNAFNLDIGNNVLKADLDVLGKLIFAEIPSLAPPTGPDQFYKCVQEVREMSLFDLLQKHLVKAKKALVDEKEKTITIDNCTFGGRVVLFNKDADKTTVEKIKKSIDEFSGPAFALKIDESDPKWPNSKEFFIVPKWMKDKAEEILQFEKYRKWREKSTEPLANRLSDFKSQYNIAATVHELEQLILYKIPLWHRVHAKKDEPLPRPPFLDTAVLVLDESFLETYTDTETAVDKFIRSIIGLYLPKTQTIVSLLKFLITNFGKSLSEYDESLIRKNKQVLSDYGEIFNNYTFKAGKFKSSWLKPPSSLDEIRKELEKIDYIKENIVKKNFDNFSPVEELPEKTQAIIKTLIEKLDKENVTIPRLCEIIFCCKLKEENGKVTWEEPKRLDACILVCVLCMANLEITFEIKNKKIFLGKDVLNAKKTKLATDIKQILAEELSWALFKNKEIDLSYLRKLNKHLEKAKKLKEIDEVTASLLSYTRKKLTDEEVEEKIKECRELVNNILIEKTNLPEDDRGKVQQFYVELKKWLNQMEVEKKYDLLILLWHIHEGLSAVSSHLAYVGRAERFNKKLENSSGLLGAYKQFDERKERSSAIITAIDKIAKVYGDAWFTESDFPQKFEKKMVATIEQLLNEQADCKKAIDTILFIPELVASSNKITSEIKEIDKRDKELESALGQFRSELKKVIDEKEKILSTYEDIKKWHTEIAKLKVVLSQLRTRIDEYNLGTEDLKELNKDFDAHIEDLESELDNIIDLDENEKKLYRIIMDNDRSFVKILKSEGITDYTKQKEQVIQLLEEVIELKKKTGINVWI